jgi:hypothetical protein
METFEQLVRHSGHANIAFVKAHDEEPDHFVVSCCGHNGLGISIEGAAADLVERIRAASARQLAEAKALAEAVR